MEWNDGKERSKFEREQRQLRKQYLAAGMNEEQIKKAYEFDLEWYKSRRREAAHTQKLDVEMDEDCNDSDGLNPMLSKFMENFSVNDKYWESERFGWIEQVNSHKLYAALKSLSELEKEILTCLIFDGLTQRELALKFDRNQSNISRKIDSLKKYLKNFL
jgi:RNA polymerase sigma factor (sigma-70 family)